MKIAIIGSGIAGLGAAWLLHRHHDITIFEKSTHCGGHSNTVTFTDEKGKERRIDTGFIVFNHQTYPNLLKLFAQCQVETTLSNMSFAFSQSHGAYEYNSDGLRGFFRQKANLLAPRHYHMLYDVWRFYRMVPQYAHRPECKLTLGEFLTKYRYSRNFQNNHILPMAAAIWSCPCQTMLDFPLHSFARFFVNHGLLQFTNRPQWYSVAQGSQQYVQKLTRNFTDRIKRQSPITAIQRHADHIALHDEKNQIFSCDQVIMACHADQALRLLAQPSSTEQDILGRFSYQSNTVILHSDPDFMPKRRKLWSSWNYLAQNNSAGQPLFSLSYWMNSLQNIGGNEQFFCTLNAVGIPKNQWAHMTYEHPIFDQQAIAAQNRLPDIQGQDRIWYCGSYFGYGFHEDALASGLRVAEQIGPALRPWQVAESSPAAEFATAPQNPKHQAGE